MIESVILIVAMAIFGEGAGLFGPQRDLVAVAIAESVLAGSETSNLSIEEVVDRYYHGADPANGPPPAWSIDVSRETLTRHLTGDPPLDLCCPFMLSDHDLRKHMLDGSTRVRSFHYQGSHLYFFDQWPEPLPSSPRLEARQERVPLLEE